MIGNNQKQHKFAVSVIASFWKFGTKNPSYEVSQSHEIEKTHELKIKHEKDHLWKNVRNVLHPISCSAHCTGCFTCCRYQKMNVVVASGFTSHRFHVILKNQCCRQIVFELFMCHDYQTCIYWLGKDQDQTHLFKFPKTCYLKRSWREAKEDEHHLLMQAVWNTNSLTNLFPGLPRPTRAL